MKKYILSCAVIAAAMGMTGCSETWDDNPVLVTHEGSPVVNFLNNPVMQDQEIMLTQSNATGTFHLTCSQPDYGYAAVATYRVQCSLTEDFANYYEIKQDFYDCANINPLNKDMARAVETISGVKNESDLPLAPRIVYVRLRAFVAQSPDNTEYLSNVVSFKGIGADYFNIWLVGEKVDIYLRGAMNDWGSPAEWQFEQDKDDNTWILKNVSVKAGEEFKVADSAWGPLNLGADGAVKTVSVGEKTILFGGNNPQNLKLDKDFKGDVKLSLAGGNYYVLFETPEE